MARLIGNTAAVRLSMDAAAAVTLCATVNGCDWQACDAGTAGTAVTPEQPNGTTWDTTWGAGRAATAAVWDAGTAGTAGTHTDKSLHAAPVTATDVGTPSATTGTPSAIMGTVAAQDAGPLPKMLATHGSGSTG